MDGVTAALAESGGACHACAGQWHHATIGRARAVYVAHLDCGGFSAPVPLCAGCLPAWARTVKRYRLEALTRRCAHCGEAKPLSDFLPRQGRCRACRRVYLAAWDAAHRDQRREINRAWIAAHPERRREITRLSQRRRRARDRAAATTPGGPAQ